MTSDPCSLAFTTHALFLSIQSVKVPKHGEPPGFQMIPLQETLLVEERRRRK